MAEENDGRVEIPQVESDQVPPILQKLGSKPTVIPQVKTNGDVPVVTDETDPEYDPKKIYKQVQWTAEDIVGSGEFQDIHYRPDGVPEDYPEEWLPGVRFKKVSAEILKRFQRIHSGRAGQGGDPDRAELYLLTTCFVSFLNLDEIADPIEYLTHDPLGKKIKSFSMTEFIIREVPSTTQGKTSAQRFKRY